jgi:ribosome maturation factor RimP
MCAMAAKKQSTAEIAEKLIEPVLAELGLELWDVRFEKEGSSWFLRYFIDRDGGVTIADCENASRAVEKLLDEADPIEQSYILEVSSPGVERLLSRDWHFARCAGEPVRVRLFRPVEGAREFIGELIGKQGDDISLLLERDVRMAFRESEAAYIKLYVDFGRGGLGQ